MLLASFGYMRHDRCNTCHLQSLKVKSVFQLRGGVDRTMDSESNQEFLGVDPVSQLSPAGVEEISKSNVQMNSSGLGMVQIPNPKECEASLKSSIHASEQGSHSAEISEGDVYVPETSAKSSKGKAAPKVRGRKTKLERPTPPKKGTRGRSTISAKGTQTTSTSRTRQSKQAATSERTVENVANVSGRATAGRAKPLSKMTKSEQRQELDRRHRAKEAEAATANFTYSRRKVAREPFKSPDFCPYPHVLHYFR